MRLAVSEPANGVSSCAALGTGRWAGAAAPLAVGMRACRSGADKLKSSVGELAGPVPLARFPAAACAMRTAISVRTAGVQNCAGGWASCLDREAATPGTAATSRAPSSESSGSALACESGCAGPSAAARERSTWSIDGNDCWLSRASVGVRPGRAGRGKPAIARVSSRAVTRREFAGGGPVCGGRVIKKLVWEARQDFGAPRRCGKILALPMRLPSPLIVRCTWFLKDLPSPRRLGRRLLFWDSLWIL